MAVAAPPRPSADAEKYLSQLPAEVNDGPAGQAEERILIRNVSWETYEALLEAVGDGLPRLTYDEGELELQMPNPPHDTFARFIAFFVAAYAEEVGIRFKATGSATWRREKKKGGLEADESFYFQSFNEVRGREDWTLEDTPPPDLAIEIDLSPPAVEKVSIYARLGVPEIWRWRRGRLTVLVLEAGEYVERERSVALPEFPLERLREALARYPEVEADEAVREFR